MSDFYTGEVPGGPPQDLPAVPSGGTITPQMVADLSATKPWVMFMAVLGFIGTGFTVLGGIVMGVIFLGPGLGPSLPHNKLLAIVVPILYCVIGIFMNCVPARYLYRFARDLGRYQEATDASLLEEALKHHKSFWKYLGLLVIATILLYILFIVIIFAVSIIAAT